MKKPQYTFTLEKYFEYEDRVQVHIISSGGFNFSIVENDDINISELCFITEQFKQNGVKEPLVFSPFKWSVNRIDKTFNIKSKSNLEAHWKRYRDKFICKENKAHFLVFERLFFKVPMGLENHSLSNSFYLPFLINVDSNIKIDDVIQSINWLLMPINIPLNTFYKCIDITSNIIKLEGWLSLDKEKLVEYLSLEKFQRKAKEYHFSQDFTINSKILIDINRNNNNLISADFELTIKGDELLEKFKYKIKGNKYDMFDINNEDPNDDAFYVIGKPRIIDPY